MKEVLELIETKRQEFIRLPFFAFLKDRSIDLKKRASGIPFWAHFVMSFKDLNVYVLRQEPTDDPIQAMINQHTYEDASHWVWYVKDLDILGIDHSLRFTDALRFLWSEETQKARQLSYDLLQLCAAQTDPVLRLAIIEAIEATGTTALAEGLVQLSQELQELTQKRSYYFSDHHLQVETGHIQAGLEQGDTEQFFDSIQLTAEQKAKAFELVEAVFAQFTSFYNGLLVYSKNHSLDRPFPRAQVMDVEVQHRAIAADVEVPQDSTQPFQPTKALV